MEIHQGFAGGESGSTIALTGDAYDKVLNKGEFQAVNDRFLVGECEAI